MSDQGYCTGEIVDSQTTFERIFDEAVRSHSNICFYGPTGTGKTKMLMRLFAELSKEKKVIITSTTARGALSIQEELGEGATIARRSGVGTSKVEHIEAAMEYIANDIHEIDILLIDDFSLLNKSRFESINNRFCQERSEHKKPFGGVRLIMAGDPYMVSPDNKPRFFKSSIWGECAFVTYELRNPFRYDAKSQHWFETLLRIRCGTVIDSDLEKIQELVAANENDVNLRLQEYWKDNETHGTTEFIMYICSTKNEVKSHNNNQLQKIRSSKIVTLKASDTIPEVAEHIKNELEKKLDHEIDKIIELKIGATVVTTRTQSSIPSGTVGVVKQINDGILTIVVNSSKEEIKIKRVSHDVKFDKYYPKRVQFPITLGYATTIHKVLGVEFEHAIISLKEPSWLEGYFYTALSRVKNYKNITLLSSSSLCIPDFIKSTSHSGVAFDQLITKEK
ncbi:ATP-dependent DNA helicase pif1-like [Aphidius gifuensis]|uniref:ATP-dependent DNA helicase pif1-like n=1 Tax=Aphidius gifuensis TaxID=684658 RepID=UPI001CDBAA8E|nr:ATP-dependent DNA helicase pif1-like [Aphidius gifuensis]